MDPAYKRHNSEETWFGSDFVAELGRIQELVVAKATNEIQEIAAHLTRTLQPIPHERHHICPATALKLAERVKQVFETDAPLCHAREDGDQTPRDFFIDNTQKILYIFSKRFGEVYEPGSYRKPSDAIAISFKEDYPVDAKHFVRLAPCKIEIEGVVCIYKFSDREIELEKLFGLTVAVLPYLSKEGKVKRVMLQEPWDGDLVAKILNNPIIPPSHKWAIFVDIVKHLQIMHGKGFIHADVKPENVLVRFRDGSWQARLADFMTAYNLNEPRFPKLEKLNQTYGTARYISPERKHKKGLLDDPTAQGKAEDIFALGVILFHLLYSHVRFPEDGYVYRHLRKVVPKVGVQDEARHALMLQLISEKPEDRLTIDAIAAFCSTIS